MCWVKFSHRLAGLTSLQLERAAALQDTVGGSQNEKSTVTQAVRHSAPFIFTLSTRLTFADNWECLLETRHKSCDRNLCVPPDSSMFIPGRFLNTLNMFIDYFPAITGETPTSQDDRQFPCPRCQTWQISSSFLPVVNLWKKNFSSWICEWNIS